MVVDWFAYPSNFSNETVVNGTGSFMKYIGFTTNNWITTGFLFIIWLFTFAASMKESPGKGLMVSGFISFLLSIYFIRLDLINPTIPIIFLVLTIVGAIISYNE